MSTTYHQFNITCYTTASTDVQYTKGLNSHDSPDIKLYNIHNIHKFLLDTEYIIECYQVYGSILIDKHDYILTNMIHVNSIIPIARWLRDRSEYYHLDIIKKCVPRPGMRCTIKLPDVYYSNLRQIEFSEYVQEEIIRHNPLMLQYLTGVYERIKELAIRLDPSSIQFIRYPSYKMQLLAISNFGYNFKYIHSPHEEIKRLALGRYGEALEYIKNPSRDLQLAAVKSAGCAVRFIQDPDEEICLAAIKNNPKALGYIKNQIGRAHV